MSRLKRSEPGVRPRVGVQVGVVPVDLLASRPVNPAGRGVPGHAQEFVDILHRPALLRG
jgi:hypothetical protein